MKIGDAAATLGVATHVLRHWEDEGLLQPRRTAGGHRDFDDEVLTRAQVIRMCQRAGLSLAEIRALAPQNTRGRKQVIDERLAEVRQGIADLRRTERFLQHLMSCRHPVISQCPDCSTLARPRNRLR